MLVVQMGAFSSSVHTQGSHRLVKSMKNFDSNLDRIRSDSRHSRHEILGSPKRDASAAAPGRVSGVSGFSSHSRERNSLGILR
jgi:hypothetical protein